MIPAVYGSKSGCPVSPPVKAIPADAVHAGPPRKAPPSGYAVGTPVGRFDTVPRGAAGPPPPKAPPAGSAIGTADQNETAPPAGRPKTSALPTHALGTPARV